MSLLSAQCDELRAMAESVGLAMPQAATLMMEAADTIWELRDSVHRERAEADRLRERITTQKQTIQAYRDESREWREVADHAQAENAKLREKLTASPQCETCEAMLDCDECLRADESAKERKRLDYENAKLRELVKDLYDVAEFSINYFGDTYDIRKWMDALGIEVEA